MPTPPPSTEVQEPPILPTGPRVDPYRMYAEMRDEAVVHLIREPNGLRRQLVLRYAEAREVLNDPRFAKDPRKQWDQLRAAGYVKSEQDSRSDYLYHLLNTDPPDHTRLRRLVSKAFTSRRVEELRPRVREVAEALLDGMGHDVVDLVDVYAHPLSTTIICEMIGVPDGDRGMFRIWATAMLTAPDMVVEGAMSPQEGHAAMHGFFTELLQHKRAEIAAGTPQGDVLTALIVASDEGDKLTEAEVISTVMLLLSAGQEPTVNLICNGMLALLSHPDQVGLLRERPDLVPSAVEEFLRYDPPVELSTMRFATEDVEIAGHLIPAGSQVTVSIASAGRDERHFPDPDRLDVTRNDHSHLAFGHGIHLCVGAPLARLEAQVAVEALLNRFPDIALACGRDELAWRPTRIMRGLTRLPVRPIPQS
ncbi:cytochrome P450 family protein [Catellatospora vulcania]|uniref:cytochrome P450 family protein n=1 Tax=Catellatospora vulcania TaxID=1460450 RepID=UPI0012D3BE7C|nr:cytochrome P450 [Catellatospora vulcania]